MSSEKLVPWESQYVIGQGFTCPGNIPVKGMANAFAAITLPNALAQSYPGDLAASTLAKNEFQWQTAYTYSDLAKSIAASASFGFKGFGSSASGEASALRDTAMSSTSIVAMMAAKFETDSWMIDNPPPVLSKAALDVLDKQGVDAFYQTFGTDFIAGQRLGASLTALVEIKMKSKSEKDNFAAKLKGSYKGVGATYKAAANLQAALQSSEEEKEVNVKISAVGWLSNQELGDVDVNTLLDVAEKFSTVHKGVPVAAVLRSFSTLPQFVDAVVKKESVNYRVPKSVKEFVVQKVRLEAIKIDILLASVNEQIANHLGDEDVLTTMRSMQSKLDAAKVTLGYVEDPLALEDLAEYIQTKEDYEDPFLDDIAQAELIASIGADTPKLKTRKADISASVNDNIAKLKKQYEDTVLAVAKKQDSIKKMEAIMKKDPYNPIGLVEELEKLNAGLRLPTPEFGRGMSIYNRIFVTDMYGPTIMKLGLGDPLAAVTAASNVTRLKVADITKPTIVSFQTWHNTFLTFRPEDEKKRTKQTYTVLGDNEKFVIAPMGIKDEVLIIPLVAAYTNITGGPFDSTNNLGNVNEVKEVLTTYVAGVGERWKLEEITDEDMPGWYRIKSVKEPLYWSIEADIKTAVLKCDTPEVSKPGIGAFKIGFVQQAVMK